MIQCYYKYKPASIEALALLVRADDKDRFIQVYIADMLRGLFTRRIPKDVPPRVTEILKTKKKKKMTAKKADSFVDKMIRTFVGKGGEK